MSTKHQPINHHYLPVFYLSRWKGDDGCICRFSKPYGNEVKSKRMVPSGTAFEPRLYETHGSTPEKAQTMETDFMAKLDSEAGKALLALETGLPEDRWSPRTRSGWSRFILAQLLRAPEDITQLKAVTNQAWEKAVSELEEPYVAVKTKTDPLTLEEYIQKQEPSHADSFTFNVAKDLMDHSGIIRIINNMHWLVIDVPEDKYSLLTSDRPVRMTSTLTEEDAYIVFPIGPRKLFTAVVDRTTQLKLRAHKRGDLAKIVNRHTVQHAVRYVFGLNDSMKPFIQKHMATKSFSTLTERLAASYELDIVTSD